MSTSWPHDVEPMPALLVLPPDAESLDEAHAAIELWEHYSGKTLDETQRLTVEVMMAQDAAGKWAAATTGREMPRQNGKGDEVEVPELWGLVQRGEAILHTVHDAVLLASQTQQRMLAVLDGHADLRRLVKRRWQGTGQQMIEMRNGGIIWYRTRTGGGGRGVDDIDRLVIDEAQHATEEHLAAVTPTLLANSNPQMNVLGTAGLAGKSAWWWSVRKRALGPDPGRFGYVGHTAERVEMVDGRIVQPEVDVEDRANWMAANPSLNAGRGGGLEFFEEQYKRLGAASFAREHLCVWDPPDGVGGESSAIPASAWDALADVDSRIASHHAWALAVSPDRQWSSLGLAGRTADGKLHVEWLEHKAGTAWIVDRVTEAWRDKQVPIRVHKQGPEATFIPLLRERGVDVVEVSSSEVAQATGQLIDGASAGAVVHLGQRSLDRALRGAVLRMTTDGATVWSQRQSSVEITPLQAVTVAAGGVPTLGPPEPMFAFSK